ncbi:hypothetical protein KIPB_011139, partial [Kipferlia bialata]
AITVYLDVAVVSGSVSRSLLNIDNWMGDEGRRLGPGSLSRYRAALQHVVTGVTNTDKTRKGKIDTDSKGESKGDVDMDGEGEGETEADSDTSEDGYAPTFPQCHASYEAHTHSNNTTRVLHGISPLVSAIHPSLPPYLRHMSKGVRDMPRGGTECIPTLIKAFVTLPVKTTNILTRMHIFPRHVFVTMALHVSLLAGLSSGSAPEIKSVMQTLNWWVDAMEPCYIRACFGPFLSDIVDVLFHITKRMRHTTHRRRLGVVFGIEGPLLTLSTPAATPPFDMGVDAMHHSDLVGDT